MIQPDEFEELYRKHKRMERMGGTSLAVSDELKMEDVEEIMDVEYTPETSAINGVMGPLNRQLMDEL